MRQFYKEVDKRSRKAMTEFLTNHFRYYTMQPWNGCTSFANNVKIHNLALPHDTAEKMYDMTLTDEYWEDIRETLRGFSSEQGHNWSILINGRNSGYLVLCPHAGRMDVNADYEDLTMWELRDWVQLVQDFDRYCDKAVATAIWLADSYDVKEEEYYVRETRMVLCPRECSPA